MSAYERILQHTAFALPNLVPEEFLQTRHWIPSQISGQMDSQIFSQSRIHCSDELFRNSNEIVTIVLPVPRQISRSRLQWTPHPDPSSPECVLTISDQFSILQLVPKMIQGAVILRSVFNRLRPGHAAAMEYAFRQNVRESARARMHAVRQEKRRLLSSRSAQDRSNPESSRDSLENPGTSGESELPNDEEEPRPDHISKDGEWIAIYRFRSIMPISLISQLKIAMSGLICVLCPYTAYMALMEERLDLLVESCGLTIATIIALIIFTNITRRLIGVIAVNRDLSSIRVGYLNFWGLRRNTIVPINDVLSLADTDPDIIGAMDSRKFAVRFQRSGAHENLYLPIYNTQIPEPELFEQVFGMQLPPECQQKMGLLRSLIALMSGDTPNRWKEKAE